MTYVSDNKWDEFLLILTFACSQLFNVHGVKDVGRAEIHTAELQVPESSAAEVEVAIDKLKSHKSPGIDQIPAELIKAGGRTICLEIHKTYYFYLEEGETA